MEPNKDTDTFAEYVSHVYTLRAEILRDNKPLQTLSFRKLFNLYLLTSLLYYQHDTSFIPDPVFDEICKVLVDRREEAESSKFWHGSLFDISMLKAGSGFHLKANNSPVYLQNAAEMIAASRQGSWESVGVFESL